MCRASQVIGGGGGRCLLVLLRTAAQQKTLLSLSLFPGIEISYSPSSFSLYLPWHRSVSAQATSWNFPLESTGWSECLEAALVNFRLHLSQFGRTLSLLSPFLPSFPNEGDKGGLFFFLLSSPLAKMRGCLSPFSLSLLAASSPQRASFRPPRPGIEAGAWREGGKRIPCLPTTERGQAPVHSVTHTHPASPQRR